MITHKQLTLAEVFEDCQNKFENDKYQFLVLLDETIHLDEMHIISGNPWAEGAKSVEITFKNRHTPAFTPARISQVSEKEFIIESSEKIQGIAPGQFGVIYDSKSEICYGSGIITGRNVVIN